MEDDEDNGKCCISASKSSHKIPGSSETANLRGREGIRQSWRLGKVAPRGIGLKTWMRRDIRQNSTARTKENGGYKKSVHSMNAEGGGRQGDADCHTGPAAKSYEYGLVPSQHAPLSKKPIRSDRPYTEISVSKKNRRSRTVGKPFQRSCHWSTMIMDFFASGIRTSLCNLQAAG
ncbi:uncharacterized protein EI97DRAFT_238694 [Westerdykella ornata]|uniref:Uncharacterized protein n=1 Tax=Westerdykella ornata TaxID=318751 RepID=A0A6A6J8M1_WESOR|nr:uncharacterized protein EI97DRAFT_238694 [Westerdykella ornata]KAF2271986.1 hypothetical protein EI97DRAFT_238694 [Westerdykella ornata]